MPEKRHKLSIRLQVEFFRRLGALRAHYLGEALASAVSAVPMKDVDRELLGFVSPNALKQLAVSGLRGEIFFMIPCLVKAKPGLVGYYRLLYGFSQKEFYSKGPYGRFKSMEERGVMSPKGEADLPLFCKEMNALGAQLLSDIKPIEKTNVHELQLLTLGPQFRGGQNTQLGQIATGEVFGLIRLLVKRYITKETKKRLELKNSLGKQIVIEFSSDPDIRIVQVNGSREMLLVSVEIKGGADVSNVHNRLGEAEKSHQKAKAKGFSQFWTISRAQTTRAKIKEESPTTTHFFDLEEILVNDSEGQQEFINELSTKIGIRS